MSVFFLFLFYFFSQTFSHFLSKSWNHVHLKIANETSPKSPLSTKAMKALFSWVSHIRNKAIKTAASEWEIRNPRPTARIANSSAVSRRRGEVRTVQFLPGMPVSPWGSGAESKVQGVRLWSQVPGDVQTSGPWALAPGLVLFTCHLSPFINNHLSQKWHISKAVPISLLFRPAQPLGQGAMGW